MLYTYHHVGRDDGFNIVLLLIVGPHQVHSIFLSYAIIETFYYFYKNQVMDMFTLFTPEETLPLIILHITKYYKL